MTITQEQNKHKQLLRKAINCSMDSENNKSLLYAAKETLKLHNPVDDEKTTLEIPAPGQAAEDLRDLLIPPTEIFCTEFFIMPLFAVTDVHNVVALYVIDTNTSDYTDALDLPIGINVPSTGSPDARYLVGPPPDPNIWCGGVEAEVKLSMGSLWDNLRTQLQRRCKPTWTGRLDGGVQQMVER